MLYCVGSRSEVDTSNERRATLVTSAGRFANVVTHCVSPIYSIERYAHKGVENRTLIKRFAGS